MKILAILKKQQYVFLGLKESVTFVRWAPIVSLPNPSGITTVQVEPVPGGIDCPVAFTDDVRHIRVLQYNTLLSRIALLLGLVDPYVNLGPQLDNVVIDW